MQATLSATTHPVAAIRGLTPAPSTPRSRDRGDNNWDAGRALHLVLVDGGGDEQLRRRRQRLSSAMGLKPESAHLSGTFNFPTRATNGSSRQRRTTRTFPTTSAIRCRPAPPTAAANATTTNQFNVLQYANQSARIYGLDLAGKMPLGRNGLGKWG